VPGKGGREDLLSGARGIGVSCARKEKGEGSFIGQKREKPPLCRRKRKKARREGEKILFSFLKNKFSLSKDLISKRLVIQRKSKGFLLPQRKRRDGGSSSTRAKKGEGEVPPSSTLSSPSLSLEREPRKGLPAR